MSLSKLEQFIFEKMSETKLPGLSAAVIERDCIVWSRGFGFRHLESGLPATPRTLCAIASITKSFTAIAIMQLAEQGKLSVDDPVDSHVPVKISLGDEPVRISHLMSHSSGLPALAYAESMIRGAVGAGEHWLPVASYEDLITFMADAADWAVARPGERWFYLNEGYVLLGYVIERCSGLSYEEYVKTHILEPLGMTRSFFDKETVENDEDTATPYIVTHDGERKPSTYPYGSITSDGGLVSNVADLARYVSMFLGSGEYRGARVLSRESLGAMQAPQVLEGWEGPFGDLAYGYGLGITPDFLGHKLVGHSGSLLVATAYMGFIPEKHVGIALLANGTGYPLSQLGKYGLAILIGEDPEKLPFVRSERALKELEGTYETYRGTMKLRVKRAGDFLNVERADKYTKDVGILVPDVIGEKTRLFYLLSGGYKLPVEFSVHERDVDLLYERYRLKRIGPLP